MAEEERSVQAEKLKEKANNYFKEKDYENAIKYYTEALDLNPSNAIYYSNRSLAYLRTECYGYALADATRALEIDKNYIKGYYRRATSNMALGKFKAALKDYETVVRVRPNDKDAKMKYQECNKIVKQKAFERAIASDELKRSVVDSLDIENMSEWMKLIFLVAPPPVRQFLLFKTEFLFFILSVTIKNQPSYEPLTLCLIKTIGS
uniref:PPP domain-containing protein n=1 Tax=Pygocentrus nattereri TaxID=42514 RepID=A0AAR2JUS8_PYGNA